MRVSWSAGCQTCHQALERSMIVIIIWQGFESQIILENEVNWSLRETFSNHAAVQFTVGGGPTLHAANHGCLRVHSSPERSDLKLIRGCGLLEQTDRRAPLITLYLERVRPLGARPPTNCALTGKPAVCWLFVLFHAHLSFRSGSPTLSAVTSNLPPSFAFSCRLVSLAAALLCPSYQLGEIGRQPTWTLTHLTVRQGDVRERDRGQPVCASVCVCVSRLPGDGLVKTPATLSRD